MPKIVSNKIFEDLEKEKKKLKQGFEEAQRMLTVARQKQSDADSQPPIEKPLTIRSFHKGDEDYVEYLANMAERHKDPYFRFFLVWLREEYLNDSVIIDDKLIQQRQGKLQIIQEIFTRLRELAMEYEALNGKV